MTHFRIMRWEMTWALSIITRVLGVEAVRDLAAELGKVVMERSQ